MSLFDYAQEVVSRKLEREKPMLTISMGMEPVMPMAQGGGLSTVQNSLNIHGQPHRLAYINPSEESLLQQLGGSGRKIDGIPAYYDPGNDSDPDSGDTTGGFDGPNDGSSDQGGITTDTNEEGMTTVGGLDVGANDPPGITTDINEEGLTTVGPGMTTDEQSFYDKANLSRQDFKEEKGFIESLKDNFNLKDNPLSILSPTLTIAKSAIDSINSQKGFGMDPMGVVGEVGPETSLDDEEGADAGGDDAADYIIKEKIAAVKNVPVEEVTVEEVERAKRLTAAQRVAGTRLEDILDQIYGSGKGAGLLGIVTNNTGTA